MYIPFSPTAAPASRNWSAIVVLPVSRLAFHQKQVSSGKAANPGRRPTQRFRWKIASVVHVGTFQRLKFLHSCGVPFRRFFARRPRL